MANDDLGNDFETEEAGGSEKKSKGIGGLLPTLLKWVAIVLGAIILIVTVLVITMKFVGGNTSQQAVIPVSQEYVGKREVLDWYTSLGQVSTKTSDALPASVIVEVVLGYKQADKAASTEITQRQIEIKDYLRRYFTELSVEDLRPRNEEKRRIEIRNAINDDILSSSKIRDVRFLSLQIIEQ